MELLSSLYTICVSVALFFWSLLPFGGTVSSPTPALPPTPSQATTPIETALTQLPSLFETQEYGGALPRILVTTPYTQGATIVLSEKKQPTTTIATSVLPVAHKAPRTLPTRDVRSALVNIFCTLKQKNEIRITTGSGVIISETGVILTNAHVAQFLLLAKPQLGITTTCTIRAGDPAEPRYTADLLYIPPLWVNENASELAKETPTGTGERDYALLYVTKSATDAPLPTIFPYLRVDSRPLSGREKNNPVIAGGFPAEVVRAQGLRATLHGIVATTTITELFTYTKNNVDMIGIAPSAVGEQGSSGGPIVNMDGVVIGLIATKGNEAKDGARSLRALTVPYIDRTIREETKVSLTDTVGSDLEKRAEIFRSVMTPLLSTIVADALEK
jgi:S1-C subfamily serine protease